MQTRCGTIAQLSPGQTAFVAQQGQGMLLPVGLPLLLLVAQEPCCVQPTPNTAAESAKKFKPSHC